MAANRLIVDLIPPANGIEADVQLKNDQLQVLPNFYSPQGTVRVAYVQVSDSEGDVRSKYMLQISGKTGELKLVKCQPVVPQALGNEKPDEGASLKK